MSKALIKSAVAKVHEAADENSVVKGEFLHGMAVFVVLVEETPHDFCLVSGPFGLKGWVARANLNTDAQANAQWYGASKRAVRSTWLDVLTEPKANSPLIMCLPRGSLLRPVAQQASDGWQQFALANGESGFAKAGNLMPYIEDGSQSDEAQIREALAQSALSYLGTQYRYGGNTPQGIDSAGLVAMAGVLNGIHIPRETCFVPGCKLRQIPRVELVIGDIVYFDKHVGMYIGEDKYVHSTNADGSDGVVINSLDENSPFYRRELERRFIGCATLFGQ